MAGERLYVTFCYTLHYIQIEAADSMLLLLLVLGQPGDGYEDRGGIVSSKAERD